MAKGVKMTYQERQIEKKFAKIDVWQARAARLLIILMLCVHPLYFNAIRKLQTADGRIQYLSNRYFRLTWQKFEFFCVCMGIVIFIVLVIWSARIATKPRLFPKDKLSVADWAILGFAAVTLISAIFSPFKELTSVWVGVEERYDGAITQLLYVAIYFIVSRWYKPRVNDFVIFSISAVIVALIGILQFYGMDFLKLWPNDVPEYHMENLYSIYFRSTLGNINIVSTYVCIAVLLNGFLFIRKKSKWQPLWLATSALSFWLMELANSDSGLVGVVVAVFFAMPFIIENRKVLGRTLVLASSWIFIFALQRLFYEVIAISTRTPGSLIPFAAVFAILLAAGLILEKFSKEPDPDAPIKWKLGVILIGACIVAGLAGIEILGSRLSVTGFAGRLLSEARSVLHGNLQDEMGSGRIYIWKHALRVFPNHPIIGTGPDTFYFAFPEEAHGWMGVVFDKAHNEYLQILICQGVLGLLCYLAFLGDLLAKSIPKAFKNPLVIAVLATFAGYCIQAFFNISLPIANQMLWVFAGMLASKKFLETPAQENAK